MTRSGRPVAREPASLVLLHPDAEQPAGEVVPPRGLAQAIPATQVLRSQPPLELDRMSGTGPSSDPSWPAQPTPNLPTPSRPAPGDRPNALPLPFAAWERA